MLDVNTRAKNRIRVGEAVAYGIRWSVTGWIWIDSLRVRNTNDRVPRRTLFYGALGQTQNFENNPMQS